MAVLEGKKHIHVTTPAGTDFHVSIEGRPSLEVTSIKRRGQMMGPLPLWAEVAYAAVEDLTHGTAVGTASCRDRPDRPGRGSRSPGDGGRQGAP